MKARTGEQILRLHLRVANPPTGVWFAVQRGKEELLFPATSTPRGLHFSLALRVARSVDGRPNFLGEFAQGPSSERFVYVNSGTVVHAPGNPWQRRAKLALGAIPPDLLARALSSECAALEARFEGTARDGGAVCASLPPSTVEWRLVQDAA